MNLLVILMLPVNKAFVSYITIHLLLWAGQEESIATDIGLRSLLTDLCQNFRDTEMTILL